MGWRNNWEPDVNARVTIIASDGTVLGDRKKIPLTWKIIQPVLK